MNWNRGYKCGGCRRIFYVDPDDFFKRSRILHAALVVGLIVLFAMPRLTDSPLEILVGFVLLSLWTAWVASNYVRSATSRSVAGTQLKRNIQLSLGSAALVVHLMMNVLAGRLPDEYLWTWLLGIPFLLLSLIYFAKAYARG